MWLPCGLPANWPSQQLPQLREPGGRGRIRTFVARKERQIYSLLVLATHPPVPVLVDQASHFAIPERRRDANSCPKIVSLQRVATRSAETQNGLVSKDTSPLNFSFGNSSASLPLPKSAVELAEGIEPPTL